MTTKGAADKHGSRGSLRGAIAAWLFIATMAAHVPTVLAQNVSVAPTRVVFEGRTRSVQVALINQGAAPATYRISFTQRRMTEDGQFEEITTPEPTDAFADQLIRYSPRQVTLEPGVAQTVRLLLRKPADLEPGEYRSHLLLRAVPSEGAGTSIESIQLLDGAGEVVQEVSSAFDGFYLFERVLPGRYTLRVNPDQLARLHLASPGEREITLASGEVVSGVDLVITEAAAS